MRERMVQEGWRQPGRVSLQCHEEWAYDDETLVQKLTGLVALCSRCHLVKHWYVASVKRGHGGRLRKGGSPHWRASGERRPWGAAQEFALHRAINPHVYHREDHFMWVNDCGIDALIEHVEEAAELCFRRSQHEWRVDFGEYTGIPGPVG